MMKITIFVACLAASLFLTRTALAWDQEGHMVVAQIAYNHLDDAVKAKCNALIAVNLGTYSSSATSNFMMAASWADDFKNTLGTGISHFIDIPFSLDLVTPTNGVASATDDVVRAINRCITTLQDPTQTTNNQAIALRYLIHFVGDIQQPLHCSDAVSAAHPTGDAGGNSVSLGGGWGNLHSLWDDGGGFLTDSVSRPLIPTGLTNVLNRVATVQAAYPYPVTVGSIPDPMTWALEGWGIATGVCYNGISPGGTPSAAYLSNAQSITMQRMAIGGQRLAKLLSTIYVTNAPNVTSTLITTNTFNLTWDTVTNRIYRVQSKPDFTTTDWTDVTDLTISNTSLTFAEPVTQQQRFYRVIVVN